MSRPLRFEFPGAWWHVTNRGVEKRDIFLDDDDRQTFLRAAASTVSDYLWRLHAFVLMNNHFHLFVETPEPTLSDGMKELGETYARLFNKKSGRIGHLFQGRFKARLVDSEPYLLNVARYVVLNPVRAGLTRTPGEWRWSSYHATAGLAACPEWLTTSAILHRFDPYDHPRARAEYCRFVGDPNALQERLWDDLTDEVYLGGPVFVAHVNEQVEMNRGRQKLVWRGATLDQIRTLVSAATGADIGTNSQAARLLFAGLARTQTRASVEQIAAALGVSRSGFGYLMRQSAQRQKTDRKFAAMVEDVLFQIRTAH